MALADVAKLFVLKDLPDSQVELSGDIPYEVVAPYHDKAIVHIAEHLELPGFRPGKVPQDMALKKVGELAVLEEAVELFVKDFYLELIEAHKVDAVGRPDIRITKLAPHNPVGLTVVANVYPTVVLPTGWKDIGKGVPAEEALPATHEEVTKTLADLQQSRKKDEVVPQLNDEFAKSLGAFESLEHLKQQITKGIGDEKARVARERRRGKILDTLIEKVTLEIPAIFVESEMQKILGQMREDIERMGLTFDDYLKRTNKTEADIRKDFAEQARKRAKLQLLLNKMAGEEKIEPEATAVEAEMKHALEHFPDAKPDLVKIHIETVLRNEQVLKLLEETK